jgi:hypothetical protein
MQPLTSQPASTSVISINACRVNHYPRALGFGDFFVAIVANQGKPAYKRMGIGRGFIATVAIQQMLQPGPTLQQTIQ